MKGQKGYVLVLKTLPHASVWQAFTRRLKRWTALYRQRHELAALSDEALKDIGLSRADTYQESERPFWEDPLKH